MQDPVYRGVIERAARICGGPEGLARLLGVPQSRVREWLGGGRGVPSRVFLKLVDLLADGYERALGASGAVPGDPAPARLPVARSLAEAALARALEAHGADFGNVQLLNGRGGLEIVAQRGFAAPFLDFFREVSVEHVSACAQALRSGLQTVVGNVATSELFAGTRAGEVLLEAGAHAVQSTPIPGVDGQVYGMISTHFRSPLGEHPLPSLEEIARSFGERLRELAAGPAGQRVG